MKTLFIFFSLIFVLNDRSYGQDIYENKMANCPKDTVLIIGSMYLCGTKNLLSRNELINADSILVNKPSLRFLSCNISSFSLGNSLNMNLKSMIIPNELKQVIASTEVSYKYLYLNNILLIDNRNNIIKSSFDNIKISFID